MFDYEVSSEDKSFHLILDDEGIEVSLGRWTDWKKNKRHPDIWEGLGQSGYVDLKIDYEKNVISFALMSINSSYEDVSRSTVRGDQLSYPFAPEADFQNVSKKRVMRSYEIPLREEDKAPVYGDGRKISYFGLCKGFRMIVVDGKVLGMWSDKKSRWIRKDNGLEGVSSLLNDSLGLIDPEMRKMAEVQGFQGFQVS